MSISNEGISTATGDALRAGTAGEEGAAGSAASDAANSWLHSRENVQGHSDRRPHRNSTNSTAIPGMAPATWVRTRRLSSHAFSTLTWRFAGSLTNKARSSSRLTTLRRTPTAVRTSLASSSRARTSRSGKPRPTVGSSAPASESALESASACADSGVCVTWVGCSCSRRLVMKRRMLDWYARCQSPSAGSMGELWRAANSLKPLRAPPISTA